MPLQEIETFEAVREIARRISKIETGNSRLTEKEIWQVKNSRFVKSSSSTAFLKIRRFWNSWPEERGAFESRLRRKTVRTSSGIAVVTVITKPFNCPHGTCTFCPGGVQIRNPQSYTKNSPAAFFGIARNYDPARQVKDMMSYLHDNGHDTSKIEMILLGGTILAMPEDYRRDFVKSSF